MKNNKLLRIFLILFGGTGYMFYFMPIVLGGICNAGTAAGLCFFGAVFLWGAFLPRLKKLTEKIRKKKAGRVITNILCVLVAAGLLTALTESAMMVAAMKKTPPENAVVVVLGCGVNGTRPSKTLNTRIVAAEKYLKEHPEVPCVICGGQGNDEDIAEAECMYRELAARGIDESRIYKEDRSTSTRENLKFAKEIIDREGLGNEIAIVTSEYHEKRAAMVAKEVGLTGYAVPAASPPGLLPVYWTRELGGVLAEALVKIR